MKAAQLCWSGGIAIALCGLPPHTWANATSAQASPPATPGLLQRSQLQNGLRVVVAEQPEHPTVSLCVSFRVGSRDEGSNQSGVAELLAQLMFQGSRNLEAGDHYRLVSGHGGTTDSTVTADLSQYCETLPAPALELGLWLEAERMKNLSLTPQNFQAQVALLQAHQRAVSSSLSHQRGRARLLQLVYQDYPPYQQAAPEGAIEPAPLQHRDALDFHFRHYTPTNAVLSIAGNLGGADVLALAERYFGAIPERAPAAERELASEAARQSSERLSVLTDNNCSAPGVYLGYRIPKVHSTSHTALKLSATILAHGDSSRLVQSLIAERASALTVQAWTEGNTDGDLFGLYIAVAPLSGVDKVVEVVEGELKRLRFFGPSALELGKAKALLRAQFLDNRSTSVGEALLLGRYEALWNDAGLADHELEALEAITPDQVRHAAQQYLPDHKRSIVEVYPPGWAQDEAPLVVVRTHTVKRGENLESIARQYGSSVAEVVRASGIDPKRAIQPGQKLKVPVVGGKRGTPAPAAPRVHTVRAGESLSVIARYYGARVADILSGNGLDAKKPIVVGQKLTIPARESEPAEHAEKSATKPAPAKKPPAKPPAPKQKGRNAK